MPSSQDASHLDHSDQRPQWPSTLAVNKQKINKYTNKQTNNNNLHVWSIMWCCLHPLTFFKRIKRTVWWPADNSSPLRECAPCKVIRVAPESEKLLPVESKIPGFGICGSAQWIRNLDNYWKQDPKFHWKGIRNPVPGAHIPQRGIQNPRQFWGHLTWSDREKHLRISAGSRPWDKVGGGRSSRPWDEGGGGGWWAVSKNVFSALQASALP